jgi:hypothetical protein
MKHESLRTKYLKAHCLFNSFVTRGRFSYAERALKLLTRFLDMDDDLDMQTMTGIKS